MEQHDQPRVAASAGCLALRGDRLAVGTWPSRGALPLDPALVFLLHRAPRERCHRSPANGGGEGRFVSSELHIWVVSSVVTIQLEASVCIIGSQRGLVQFWDIQSKHASQLLTINTADVNLDLSHSALPWYSVAIYYRKPSLYVAGCRVSVFRPKHTGSDNIRQLWDYPSDEIEPQLIYADGRREDVTVGDLGFCRLVPQAGSAFVQAVSPDRRLLMIAESSVVAGSTSQIHRSEKRLVSKNVRCLATTPGYFGIGTEATTNPDHRQPRTEAEVHLLHEDGEAIATFEDHFGDINCLAMDPCFFVSVSDDHSVMMRDYRPQTLLSC